MQNLHDGTKPKLRPVEAFPVRMEGREWFCLRDPQALAEQPIFLNRNLMFLVSRMDGSRTLRDIQADYFRAAGEIFPFEDLEMLARQLDENHFLDSPAFNSYYEAQVRAFLESPVRPARHTLASDDGDHSLASRLEAWLREVKTPDASRPLRGLISPHIDYERGGPTYAHAYRALAADPDADRFIIFGTCHTPMRRRFALSLKDYETPLGRVATDCSFVRSLASKLADDYFEDEFSHRGEHSIELQTVWMKHIMARTRDFTIVPILVGSFADICAGRQSAAADKGIRAMTDAIRNTMEELPGRYCLIAAADLAHVGRRFGDPAGPTEAYLRRVEEEDRRLLDRAAACDAEGVLASIAADNNRRNVCGYPPIYMTLRCLGNSSGTLLEYKQWSDFQSGAAVTFAAVAFY